MNKVEAAQRVLSLADRLLNVAHHRRGMKARRAKALAVVMGTEQDSSDYTANLLVQAAKRIAELEQVNAELGRTITRLQSGAKVSTWPGNKA